MNTPADKRGYLGPRLLQVLRQVDPERRQALGQPLMATLERQGLDALFVGRQAAVLALVSLCAQTIMIISGKKSWKICNILKSRLRQKKNYKWYEN